MNIIKLTVEQRDHPTGIDIMQPRFGWKLVSGSRSQKQSAYRIQVASDRNVLQSGQADIWDSGCVQSNRSTHIRYEGPKLRSNASYYWHVQVWDGKLQPSQWSEIADWSTGLLEPAEWRGQWIGFDPLPGEADNGQSCSCLRRTFELDKPVRRAFLYATARGLYECSLNGERVGMVYLTPGWTNYHHRLLYQCYDVTEQLHNGVNAISAILGAGWYAGHVAHVQPGFYGRQTSLLVQLSVEFEDGSSFELVSDEAWKASLGGITAADLIMGESYDARLEPIGWQASGYDDSDWLPCRLREPYAGSLQAQRDSGVRAVGFIQPKAIHESTEGIYIVDMGQNMAGWVRLRADGPMGTVIRLRYAEMVDETGSIYTESLRSARQQDEFILDGEGPVTFEPHFTCHGFRYVEIAGYPGVLLADAVEGIVLSSASAWTGRLETGNRQVNQLHSNVEWSLRGNFISIPTDCPQRDERLGWLGDAQIFARTASFLADLNAFFARWMEDVEADQFPSGAYPDIVPYMPFVGGGSAGWGDAGVIIPWTVFQVYQDREIIHRHYESMTRWIHYLETNSDGLIRPDEGYGDWLSIAADTPKDVLATAYFAYSTGLLAEMAEAIGQKQDALQFRSLFERVVQAFNLAFVSEDGMIKGDTQTVYVMALHMNLLPSHIRPLAAARLVEDIRDKQGHLSTGFLGVGYLLPVLCEAGYVDTAYELLLQNTFPSWLYSIGQGATTIWERWDGWTQENGFQDPGMNSFNHYSLGSVVEWMYRYMAGIDLKPGCPGYSDFVINPRLSQAIGYCKAEFDSIYGSICSEWRIEELGVFMRVVVPVNTAATVYIPVEHSRIACLQAVTESGGPVLQSEGITFHGFTEDRAVFGIGSGDYSFFSKFSGS